MKKYRSKKKSKKKSKKELNETFIYEFKTKNKITNIKKSQTVAINIFNQFLINYIYINQKKKKLFPKLTILNYELSDSKNKNTFYYFITTTPYTNHPFTIYGNYNSDTIYIIIPVGREIGQFNIKKIKKEIKKISYEKKIAIKKLLEYTIRLRKYNFLNQKKENNQFFNCMNLIECKKKINIIKKKKDFKNEIELKSKVYNEEYKKINNNIKIYFNLLKSKKLDEAKKYLLNIKKLYIQPKDIIGHLAILIEIYKLLIDIKELI